jgi:hypothetical protein
VNSYGHELFVQKELFGLQVEMILQETGVKLAEVFVSIDFEDGWRVF